MNKNFLVKWLIYAGLGSVLLIPFFVADGMFFPYIVGKNFAFRIIIEIIFALWVYLAFVDPKYRPKFSWVTVSVGVFAIIMTIADIFSVNPLKAIWSNYERMDGLVTLIHLVMYLFVFGSVMKTEKNWLWFFRTSVISSVIMIILVLKDWLTHGTDRVSVTLGNPIYLAVYFMFNFFFVLILLYKDVIVKSLNDIKPIKSVFKNWLTYVYLIGIFICGFGIWRTSTRGVILGLLGGLVLTSIIIAIFEKKSKKIRLGSIGVLVFIAILIGGFISIKNTQFVQNNLTLKRLADISWTQVAGQGQARQYVWPMALKGFKEKPILGWGQEGFSNVFNKYYDARMYSQEQWFDRAHNTPLDILIAGGILGLISYLAIFIASIFVLLKKKNNFDVVEISLVIGLLGAYFAQNLFVFDNLISYILFYVVLAYLYSRDTQDENSNPRIIKEDIINYVVVPILVVVFGVAVWFCNIKPINANNNLIKAITSLRSQTTSSITQSDVASSSLKYFNKVFSANTFGSSETREQLVTIVPQVINSSGINDEIKREFVNLGYEQMKKQIELNPNDARYQYFMGVYLDNLSQYQIALTYLQKAVELSPNKLTMLFELAKCYAYLGQKEQSLVIAKQAYDLVPEYEQGKMNYAAALILNDQEKLAKEILGSETTTSENIVRMYLIKASGYAQKGDKNSAVAEVRKAIKMVPGFKEQGEKIIEGVLKGNLK